MGQLDCEVVSACLVGHKVGSRAVLIKEWGRMRENVVALNKVAVVEPQSIIEQPGRSLP